MAFYRAMDLEAAGKYREAVPLFRSVLRTPAGVNALLGLERVYAELGWTDSLVAPLDSLIAANPREETYRTVQLRTLDAVGREADLRRALDRWIHDAPSSPTPYREYAKLLLQHNRASAADSVIARANAALGTTKDLSLEVAQARAAQGQWVESARAWREALVTADYLEQAAAYALAPAPSSVRGEVRSIFLALPIDVPARRALADLEASWGSLADGWNALKGLPPDSTSAAAWSDFAQRAESEDRWTIAREALESALRWKRTPELSVRAATAALNSGDAAAALRLAPLTDISDSALAARENLPMRVKALAALGRAAEAQQLIDGYDKFLTPGAKNSLTRTVAWGWVRTGDMTRARAALAATGVEGDSSDAAGWLALYDGNLKVARGLLRGGTESSPELALALGLVARLKVDSAPSVGHAFLALAKGDSAGAAAQFVLAADSTPVVRSLLLATAAQLDVGLGNDEQAAAMWSRILEQDKDTPEAPQAELEWARLLRRNGDSTTAVTHLEHLILTYPGSSLVPQARRELDLIRTPPPPER
jgi:tetratricopeptide (TPR) repeat protein